MLRSFFNTGRVVGRHDYVIYSVSSSYKIHTEYMVIKVTKRGRPLERRLEIINGTCRSDYKTKSGKSISAKRNKDILEYFKGNNNVE